MRRIRGMSPRRRFPPPIARPGLAAALLALAALAGCTALERLPDQLFDSRSPRERYVDAISAAGLTGTALAADWLAAAQRALAQAPTVTPPHEEVGYLIPAEAGAIAFAVDARRGQELYFSLEMPGDTAALVFLEAWHDPGSGLPPELVASADSGSRSLELRPRRDGRYILRAQPELLRGGRFTAALRLAPTLAFPVTGGRDSDVGSRFGAPRDGGRRSHHGVDIFARRGTPVIASAAGTVNRVQNTNLGGLVVWLRDDEGNRLYYAHLDSQLVTAGQRVEAGDTIGTVGNTGNARTTPPHLHFGVYRRGEGPVDPWWFIHQPRGSVPRLVADTSRLGDWVRVRPALATLRAAPAPRADSVHAMEQHTALRVVAAVGEWYRVRLPDGRDGYLPASLTEPAATAIAAAELDAADTVLARPGSAALHDVLLDALPAPRPVDVLARFDRYLMIRLPDGASGWIDAS